MCWNFMERHAIAMRRTRADLGDVPAPFLGVVLSSGMRFVENLQFLASPPSKRANWHIQNGVAGASCLLSRNERPHCRPLRSTIVRGRRRGGLALDPRDWPICGTHVQLLASESEARRTSRHSASSSGDVVVMRYKVTTFTCLVCGQSWQLGGSNGRCPNPRARKGVGGRGKVSGPFLRRLARRRGSV